MVPDPILCDNPSIGGDEENEIFPSCAVTRAMAKKIESTDKGWELYKEVDYFSLEDTFLNQFVSDQTSVDKIDRDVHSVENARSSIDCTKRPSDLIGDIPLTRDKLIAEQETDNELKVLSQKALTLEEAQTVPVCYYMNHGVLMRKWRYPDAPVDQEWQVFNQIVIPKAFRNTVIGLGHDSPMSGHLGINKTYKRVLTHFYWLKMKRDIVK